MTAILMFANPQIAPLKGFVIVTHKETQGDTTCQSSVLLNKDVAHTEEHKTHSLCYKINTK